MQSKRSTSIFIPLLKPSDARELPHHSLIYLPATLMNFKLNQSSLSAVPMKTYTY